MIVRARMESVRFEDFDIPDNLAAEFERDVEVNIPEGEIVSIRMLRSWARSKGIRLVSTYGKDI